jgi:hypothetical protein
LYGGKDEKLVWKVGCIDERFDESKDGWLDRRKVG